MEGVINYEYLVKVKMIGDSGVGKSSILQRFIEDKFEPDLNPTIGVDYRSKFIEADGKVSKVIIWDTAGQERFRTITKNYYRGSHGLCFVFDVTSKESFNSIAMWLSEAEAYFPERDVIMLLVGNKVDLSEKRRVSEHEAETFARENGMMYIETSAKTNKGVKEAFEELVTKSPNVLKNMQSTGATTLGGGKTSSEEGSSKIGCC